MLHKLELTNFKKHESLTVDFTTGLNVFRAANEAGKSSIYHAIRYAFWGSRALPDSLEETATWGKPVSSLRVSLEFSIAGIPYKIVRHKGGAELTGEGLVVSGQAEVTAHVERLTGANMAVGMATLLASQGGLQGSLDGSAVALIEKLSNLGLVDAIVGRVQENLPCGNTKLIEQQLSAMTDLEVPIDDAPDYVAEIQRASISILSAQLELDTQESNWRDRQETVKAASARISADSVREGKLRAAEVRLQQAQRAVALPVDEYDGPSISELELKVAEQVSADEIRNAYVKFEKAEKLIKSRLAMPGLEVEKLRDVANAKMAELVKLDRRLAVETAHVTAAAINEESCKLCGKNLTDVPEVVAVNSQVAEKLSELKGQSLACSMRLDEIQKEIHGYADVLNAASTYATYLASIAKYVKIDESTTPTTAEFTAQLPQASDIDWSTKLSARRKQLVQFERDKASYETEVRNVEKIKAELVDLRNCLQEPGDAELVAKHKSDGDALRAQGEALTRMRNDLAILREKDSAAKAAFAARMSQYVQKKEQKASLSEMLQKYNSNNALIKKLREVRPVVARELWALVLSSVSHTFSQIRGVQSTVTRSDTKFLIDGKPASVYSGSTQDSLGLAIRIVLQKTFLPNVDSMLLDEVAAGCDSTREEAMIACLSASGFPQTMLVTHSELADTFASNLIVI
jgi:DNA repair exonuclease SbcCD ATPase subunit